MSETAPDVQLVLTDFDGTVVEFGKHIVSDAVRQTVIACEDQGVRMVPVTGRYHRMAQPVLELLGFEDLGVFDNGATIQNCKSGEIIWSKWLGPDVVRQVASVCAPGAEVIDYTGGHDEHEPADNELEIIAQTNESTSHVYALIKPEAVEHVREQLAKIEGITFYSAPSSRDHAPDAIGFQVNHIEADKFHGVNALRKIIGVSKDNTLAIGDGENDIALFENAAIKVAMGNATEGLKAKADIVVDTVQNDGFVAAMRQFVLR